MGSVTRRTLAVVVAAPALAASVSFPATAAYAPAQATETKVAANGQFKFDPEEITISAGSKVTWTNTGGGYHSVTGGDGTQDPNSPMKGEVASQGSTYSVTFSEPGTYPYYCIPHISLGMTGTVIVTAGGATTATAAPATSAPAASSAPPASASASASVGAPQAGAGAPTDAPHEEGEGGHEIPGVKGNKTLESIEAQRASEASAVSGFRFFAAVATAFLFILGVAVMFSTRPRRAGR